ncbi:MAG: TlpA family protein disulfide reductase [Desulfobulbaceae bacterium]
MKQISLLFTLLCLSLLVTACEQGPTGVTVGAPAPNFTLQDMKGTTWNLSELNGQVVFVNFWATWCPPCREEMPSMQKLLDSMPKDKFKMLAILNRDTRDNAELFMKKLGVTLPVLNDMGNNVGQMYGITGLPETFIIDKQGVIREKIIGPAQWDSPQIEQMMLKYINENPK